MLPGVAVAVGAQHHIPNLHKIVGFVPGVQQDTLWWAASVELIRHSHSLNYPHLHMQLPVSKARGCCA